MESVDLWRDLTDRIERDEIDCIVHIGDNVYNDTDYCDIEQYGMSAKNSCGGMAGEPSMQEVIHHYSKRTGGWKNLDPIIGLVTDTTARVLVELTQEQEVTSAPSSPCRQAATAWLPKPAVRGQVL